MSSQSKFQSIPKPEAEVKALRKTADATREAVELLVGHRGTGRQRAVTLQDLIDLGLITASEIQGKLGIKFSA